MTQYANRNARHAARLSRQYQALANRYALLGNHAQADIATYMADEYAMQASTWLEVA